MRAEVHEHGGIALDIDDAAKAVLVVRHQIAPLVGFGRFLDDRDIERTTRQVPSPRAGARWFHLIHSTRFACVAGLWPGSGCTNSKQGPEAHERPRPLTSNRREFVPIISRLPLSALARHPLPQDCVTTSQPALRCLPGSAALAAMASREAL